MVLPLLVPLGLMAMAAAGKRGLYALEEGSQARGREDYKKTAEGMQQGIDINTPEGVRAYAMKQLTDPRMAQYGNQMLGSALERAQQDRQWEWGNNNLTKQQQGAQDIQRDSLASQVSEAKSRMGLDQQRFGLQQMQAQQDQQAREWAQNNMTPYQQAQIQLAGVEAQNVNPEAITKRTDQFRGERKTALNDYTKVSDQYNQVMGVLNNPNPSPLDLNAAVVGFSKTFDPTSSVMQGETENIRSDAGGVAGQMRQLLQQYSKGGMTKELRKSFADTLAPAVEQRYQSALSAQEYLRRNAEVDPVLSRAGVERETLMREMFPDMESPTKKWKKDIVAGVKPSKTDIEAMAKKQGIDLSGGFKFLGSKD